MIDIEKEKIILQLNELSEFKPLQQSSYEIYYIHRYTSLGILHYLLQLSEQTKRYTIDTESDFYTCQPALIQIEFLTINNQTTIVLFEMAHLPLTNTHQFHLIQRLIQQIFYRSNCLFTWDNVQHELESFLQYHLFKLDDLDQINTVNLQVQFKQWYNQEFLHDPICFQQYHNFNDHELCQCEHRPYKNRHHRWSLQMAIAKTFNEYLDKPLQKSQWTYGLDHRLDLHYYRTSVHQTTKYQMRQLHRSELTKYAVNDCFSVTKLAMVIENKWTKQQLEQYKHDQKIK